MTEATHARALQQPESGEVHARNLGLVVAPLRERLLTVASQLPRHYGMVLRQHFQERVAFARGELMMGELAGFFFADLLGANPSVVERVAFPWMLFYEHCLLVDDLWDRGRAYGRDEAIAAGYLLEVSRKAYAEVIGDDAEVWRDFNRYYEEWLDTMATERRWADGHPVPEWDEAIMVQGRKAATAKFCAAAVCLLVKGRRLTGAEELGVDRICAAVQLLDDVRDIWEDHTENRTNVLLQMAQDWLGANEERERRDATGAFDYDELRVALLDSGALTRAWSDAGVNLTQGLEQIQAIESSTLSYLRGLAKQCETFAGVAGAAGAEAVDRPWDARLERAQWLLENGPVACQ